MAEKEEEPSSKEPGERGDKERPATEKPIPSQSRLTQYIVSVDEMGYARKIEKLNEATGERKELSNEEYAAAYSLASSVAPYYAHCATTMYDPLHSAAMQNYVKSVSDYLEYLKTLTQKR